MRLLVESGGVGRCRVRHLDGCELGLELSDAHLKLRILIQRGIRKVCMTVCQRKSVSGLEMLHILRDEP